MALRMLGGQLAEGPVAVVAARAAEHLPQRRKVGGVDDLDRLDVHLPEPLGRHADDGALARHEARHGALGAAADAAEERLDD